MEPERNDDEPTWESLTPPEKFIAALGMTGIGLGILAALITVTLAGVLVVASLSGDLVKADSVSSLFWAAGLCLPCSLLASTFAAPLRLALRLIPVSDATKLRAEMTLSAATTFWGVVR